MRCPLLSLAQGDIGDNAIEPPAKTFEIVQGVELAKRQQPAILHRILGVGQIAQNVLRHALGGDLVPFDQRP